MGSIVQTAVQDGTSPISVAMPSNVTAGNLLVVFISGTPAYSTPSYSDTRGLTYTVAVTGTNVAGAQSRCQIVLAPVTSSGAQTVTVTSDTSAKRIRIVEISGVGSPATDATSTGTADTSTSVTTGTATTSNSSVLFLGVASDDQSASTFNSTTPSAGTSYLGNSLQAVYIDFVGAGTYSFTAGKTGNGNRSAAAIALISFTPSSLAQPQIFVIT